MDAANGVGQGVGRWVRRKWARCLTLAVGANLLSEIEEERMLKEQ